MRILLCSLLAAAAPAMAQEIVVGQSAPLTGGNAELGNDIRNGALAYFRKINEAGGLPQGKLKLVTLDDRNETKLSADNTLKLVEEQNVVALFGYASSTLSIPAMWPISTVPATEVKSDGVEVICRSKIITGMPAARIFSMPVLAASKSTAARMTAAGFRLMTSSIWLSWVVDWFCPSSETTS